MNVQGRAHAWLWGLLLLCGSTQPAHAFFVSDPVGYDLSKKAERVEPIRPDGPGLLANLGLVQNGDFAAGLNNWTSTGNVVVVNEEAVIGDNSPTNAFLYQIVASTPGIHTIEFDVRSGLSDEVPQGTFPDTFFASLYFVNDATQFNLPAGQFDFGMGLMDMDFNGVFNSNGTLGPSIKGADWLHFAASFNNGFNYVVATFELFNLNLISGDSSVQLDNVFIAAVIPEPSTWCLGLAGLAAAAAYRGFRSRRKAAQE